MSTHPLRHPSQCVLTTLSKVFWNGFLKVKKLGVEGLGKHGDRNHGLDSEIIDGHFPLNALDNALEAYEIDEVPIRRMLASFFQVVANLI